MRTVVALGGNALCSSDRPTIAAQRERVAETAVELGALESAGHDLVVTHGNGPQVGHLLRQEEQSEGPARPLDVLVAETQGQLGYLLQQALDARLAGRVATVVTRVRVDPDDPAFDEPTKPVGPTYSAEAAAAKEFETTEVATSEGETAHRRVVPSPRPQSVLERDRIRTLVEDGAAVVCGGGGGVPVVERSERDDGSGGGNGSGGDGGSDGGDAFASDADAARFEGVAAVVDKDFTSARVATAVDADVLVMATNVPCAYRNFGTEDEERIAAATPAELREDLERGEFAAGSMRPKIEACLAFLAAGGERAHVTATNAVEAAVAGDAGTTIR